MSAESHDNPRFTELLQHYLEELRDQGFIDPDAIISSEPELGPALVEYIETYIQCGKVGEAMESEAPLGELGDYTLRRKIGRGGMGVVYEAWQNSMKRTVALKVLPPGIASDDRAYQRFMQEARAAGKLGHPNMVHVHGMGIEGNTPYYAMEYVDGANLDQVLQRIKEVDDATETEFGRKGELAFYSNLASAFAEVADGLQHAHSKGVIHRDIKPSNLMLGANGCLRILDFGLARLQGQESSLTLSGDVLGTLPYMSPEQVRRKRIPVDHRTDVYSLGATLYEALCGRRPFPLRGNDREVTASEIIGREPMKPRARNPQIPKDLQTITLKCLRKDPDDRYQTAEALHQDLKRFVRGVAIEARPLSAWETGARWIQRRKKTATVIAVTVLAGLVSAWMVYAYHQSAVLRTAEARLSKQQAVATIQADDNRSPLWSERAELSLRSARELDPGLDVQGALAATCFGLDARLAVDVTVDASSLIFFHDAGRERLAVGPWTAKSSARVFDPADGRELYRSSITSPGRLVELVDGSVLYVGTHKNHLEVTPLDESVVSKVALPPGYEFTFAPNGFPALSQSGTTLAVVGLQSEEASPAVGFLDLRTRAWSALPSSLGAPDFSDHVHGAITALASTPDGAWTVVGDSQGVLYAFPQSFPSEAVIVAQIPQRAVSAVAVTSVPTARFSAMSLERGTADGILVAAAYVGGEIRLFDVASRNETAILRGSRHYVSALAFSPDASLLASVGRYELRLWGAARGELLLRAPASNVATDVAWSSRDTVASVGVTAAKNPGRLQVWNLSSGRSGVTALRGLREPAAHFAVSSAQSNARIAALSYSGIIACWDDSGELLFRLDTSSDLAVSVDNAAVSLSLDGQFLAFSGGRSVLLVDIDAARLVARWDGLPLGYGDQVCFDRGQNALLHFRWERESSAAAFRQLAFSPEPDESMGSELLGTTTLFSKKLFVSRRAQLREIMAAEGVDRENRRRVAVFNMATGEVIRTWDSTRTGGAGSVTFDARGEYLATALSEAGPIQVWPLSSRGEPTELPRFPRALFWDRGRQRFAYLSADGFHSAAELPRLRLGGSADALLGADAPISAPTYVVLGFDTRTARVLGWGDDHGRVFVVDVDQLLSNTADIVTLTNNAVAGVDWDISELGPNWIGSDPGRGSLFLNDGEILTHPLIEGNSAIDAGSSAGAPLTRQNGVIRPTDADQAGLAEFELGAFEYSP